MILKRMVKTTHDSPGLLHQVSLKALRDYIKTTSEEELIKQVKEIKDVALLRTLWEAGLSSGLQAVVLERLEKLS